MSANQSASPDRLGRHLTGRHEPEIEYRITAEAILDTKRKRKSKTKKGAEERITSDEDDLAPRFDAKEVAFNDPLPF